MAIDTTKSLDEQAADIIDALVAARRRGGARVGRVDRRCGAGWFGRSQSSRQANRCSTHARRGEVKFMLTITEKIDALAIEAYESTNLLYQVDKYRRCWQAERKLRLANECSDSERLYLSVEAIEILRGLTLAEGK